MPLCQFGTLLLAVITLGTSQITMAADFACPLQTDFACHADNMCISWTWLCDSEADCPDGSDELPQVCSNRNCSDPYPIKCKSGMCIGADEICDRYKDCPDEDDEAGCVFPSREPCADGKWQCISSGDCIDSNLRCNYRRDCDDASDEETCAPHEFSQPTCGSDQFTCTSPPGVCIPLSWKCDGEADCIDGSDEHNCGRRSCAERNMFACGGGVSEDGQCVPHIYVCDRDRDCSDGSDEFNCTNLSRCPPDLNFDCGLDDRCLPEYWVCDGENDCINGKDELNCETCKDVGDIFHCDGRCNRLSPSVICDGFHDCHDLSDESESHCGNLSKRIDCDTAGHFTCHQDNRGSPDYQCIQAEKVCDGQEDCYNGEDEHAIICDHQVTDGCKDVECEHGECVPTYDGHYCRCQLGYELKSVPRYRPSTLDERNCQDIDECTERRDNCSQICHNTKGSFKCRCDTRYYFTDDITQEEYESNRCQAKGGASAEIWYGIQNEIRSASEGELHTLATDVGTPLSIYYDIYDKRLFITSHTQFIWYELSEKDTTKKMNFELDDPTHWTYLLGYDYIVKNLYVCKSSPVSMEVKGNIIILSVDTDVRKVVIDSVDGFVESFIVDPSSGYMFWAHYTTLNLHDRSMIVRARLDGSQVTTLHSSINDRFYSLALDLPAHTIYYMNNTHMMMADYNGSRPSTIKRFTTDLVPHKMVVFENSVFYIRSSSDNNIYKINKRRVDDNESVVLSSSKPITSLQIVHHSLQPSIFGMECSHAPDDSDYTGRLSRTINNLTCVAWNQSQYSFEIFPDANINHVNLLENYCRNSLSPWDISEQSHHRAWCYTDTFYIGSGSPGTHWDECSIKRCRNYCGAACELCMPAPWTIVDDQSPKYTCHQWKSTVSPAATSTSPSMLPSSSLSSLSTTTPTPSTSTVATVASTTAATTTTTVALQTSKATTTAASVVRTLSPTTSSLVFTTPTARSTPERARSTPVSTSTTSSLLSSTAFSSNRSLGGKDGPFLRPDDPLRRPQIIIHHYEGAGRHGETGYGKRKTVVLGIVLFLTGVIVTLICVIMFLYYKRKRNAASVHSVGFENPNYNFKDGGAKAIINRALFTRGRTDSKDHVTVLAQTPPRLVSSLTTVASLSASPQQLEATAVAAATQGLVQMASRALPAVPLHLPRVQLSTGENQYELFHNDPAALI